MRREYCRCDNCGLEHHSTEWPGGWFVISCYRGVGQDEPVFEAEVCSVGCGAAKLVEATNLVQGMDDRDKDWILRSG